MNDPSVASALVVLHPAGGPVTEPVTAATIADHQPDPAVVERLRDWFAEQGFEVGPLVGTSFSITAPADTMAATFSDFAGGPRELDLGGLPPETVGAVQAVAVGAPPAFGPGNP